MNEKQLIPVKDCLLANVSEDIVALHETGHVMVMYALNMMDHFLYVTKKAGSGTLGLTEMSDDYKATLIQCGNDITQLAANLHTGADFTRLIRLTRCKSAQLYFANICRLFGGGAICRYYHVPDEAMCSIDYNLIDTILIQFNLMGEREQILKLVDKYLNSVFATLDLLSKAIYMNLVKHETLTKEQVMQIIEDWEQYTLLA
jgi:hypothetical protein